MLCLQLINYKRSLQTNIAISRSHSQVDSMNIDSTNITKTTTTDITVEVHRTLPDAYKRRQNVVVMGLPESQHITDKQAFLNLRAENFSFKPALSHAGCRRLGKISDQHKSHKLLIHLRSEEETANSILCDANRLRHCNDPADSSSVYINPDRSPAESKLAFEMRQQKRKRRADLASKMNKQKDHSTDSTSAPVLAGNSNLPSPDAVVDFVPMSANVNVQSHTVANTSFR